MQNPQTAMQHMFGNDPKFQQAMKMAQGKTPDQLKETAFNLAKTQGIDPKQIMGVLSNYCLYSNSTYCTYGRSIGRLIC